MALGDSQPRDGPSGSETNVRKDLAGWWKGFKKNPNQRKEDDKAEPTEPQGIFGVPLQTSVRYANVAISLSDADGRSYIYGYVPIVVAKCGVFLKEKATDVEGIFRLSGSEKRIKELRNAFNSPDRYGKGLDWTGYTVHDAANILRRYFNQLPEPIIPLEFYDKFREPIRNHQSQAVGPMEGQSPSQGEFNSEAAIKTYQKLITELPPLNRQLLLYILDLLAVFASKSDLNKMTTPNLAAIFQPGILSHPAHDMAPPEYRLSQDVLIFLIENQDHFLIGMQGTAADEKTVQEVESGPPTPSSRSATPKHSKSAVHRSGSNSSRYSGVRRSVSASSRRSRSSVPAAPSPAGSDFQTPLASPVGSGGVHRSNTLPPSRSPNLTHGRFGRDEDGAQPALAIKEDKTNEQATPKLNTKLDKKPHTQAVLQEVMTPSGQDMMSLTRGHPLMSTNDEAPTPTNADPVATRPDLKVPPNDTPLATPDPYSAQPTPTGSRTLSGFFAGRSPSSDAKKPNKLQKKRSPMASAHSSTHSLNDPTVEHPSLPPIQNSLAASAPLLTPMKENRPPPLDEMPLKSPPVVGEFKPGMSPTTSYMSQSDAEPPSLQDHYSSLADSKELAVGESGKKRHWFSRNKGDMSVPESVGSNGQAARSRSSVLSGDGRKSGTFDRRSFNADRGQVTSETVDPYAVTSDSERESRRNPIRWIKGKIQQHQDKRDEKRVASPTRNPETKQQGLASVGSVVSGAGLITGQHQARMPKTSDEEKHRENLMPLQEQPSEESTPKAIGPAKSPNNAAPPTMAPPEVMSQVTPSPVSLPPAAPEQKGPVDGEKPTAPSPTPAPASSVPEAKSTTNVEAKASETSTTDAAKAPSSGGTEPSIPAPRKMSMLDV